VTATPWPSGQFLAVSKSEDWRSGGRAPVRFSYSWLRCDLHGKHCVPLRGAHTRQLVPPQELRIVTVRAVVTAANEGGAATVVSRNFSYDEAGRARTSYGDLYPPIYDPKQFRHWFGLRPSQNGTDQTIVVTALWSSPKLRAAVDRFSTLYGLPLACGSPHAGSNCFELDQRNLGPVNGAGSVEDQDVEWIHALAPQAQIVVLHGGFPPALAIGVRDQEFNGAHVFSASWGWHFRGLPDPRYARAIYSVGRACNHPHVVCTFPSGDSGAPGDLPSNSPFVLAVGGTRFRPVPDGATVSEKYWTLGGFGVTKHPLPRPAWQKATIVCGRRACPDRVVPDVSATASDVGQYEFPPGTPHHERDGWFFGGGTSLSSPLWAALIALADQQLALAGRKAIGIAELHAVLYRGGLSAGLDDMGHRGWSKQTGWGAPKAGIVDVLVKAIERYRRG
jgi:subtilase family serine protease